MSAELSPPEQRRGSRQVFAIGIVVAVVLVIVAIAGPPLMSSFFPGDGTGSRGNPERVEPVPRTK